MTVTGLGAAMGVGAAVWYLRKKKQFARMYVDVTSSSCPAFASLGSGCARMAVPYREALAALLDASC